MIRYIGEPIMALFKNIFDSAQKFSFCALTGLATLFAPISVNIICAGVFILVDWFLGYAVSRKFKRSCIESNKVWKTISKILEAMLLITGAYVIDQFVVTSLDLHAVELVSGLICGAEFISWLEALIALHPDNRILKLLGKVIKSKAEKYLDVELDDKDLQINTRYNDKDNTINR